MTKKDAYAALARIFGIELETASENTRTTIKAWEARELLERTLQLTTEPPEELWFQLGLACRDSGRPADAYWALAFARSIDPPDAAVLAALVDVAELVGEHAMAQV